MAKNPEVNWFFEQNTKWREAYCELREVLISSELTEELKWGTPCYTLGKQNVVLIHGFKDYCALLFMKGAIMDDPNNILIQQTKNVQAARQIRFSNLIDLLKQKTVLFSYIKNAIDVEKSKVKIELKKTSEYIIPEEFKLALEEVKGLNEAFLKLTPGRQRAYILYFSSAIQSKTRVDRIEKYASRILEGIGLND
ncbi:MAG: YdeI/OmpD-associated family protein [Saprospiraceae bacterium]|jgi:uncharacterized protein YdeI (YjbR/CyaY-like superfamily)|nr:YdeI/OmpD-associated family protein [Saprospiraceae bacterium]MBK7795998.1 YdeI/OmpD-associated family protein [Saprospiraceae bacterium]MBL0261109.1 YdeI/OmpD-associated family protein [Saprospiraceae bacterium]